MQLAVVKGTKSQKRLWFRENPLLIVYIADKISNVPESSGIVADEFGAKIGDQVIISQTQNNVSNTVADTQLIAFEEKFV